MLQPFAVAESVLDVYRRYVRASFPLREESLDAQREQLIDRGLLWTDLHVALARPGLGGPNLTELGDLLLERTRTLPWGFEQLYEHQFRAVRRLVRGGPTPPLHTLVLSGTGSGKTEAFLLPIVDACIREPGPGVRALVIYPMNALANDQLKRLGELLRECPDVTFGRYTGDAPETDAGDDRRPPRPPDAPVNLKWSRQAMRESPPNIMLTNYTQLEYLLLRRVDADHLFRFGAPWYVVVDEIHLFGGVLGAEVACLLRRFRQHVGAAPKDFVCVGTSATAGDDAEQARLLAFASRFFGAAFDSDAAISETPAPFPEGGDVVSPPPALTDADLAGAATPAGLSALADKLLASDLTAGRSEGDLSRSINRYQTVHTVERALARPAPISAAAAALRALPGRGDLPDEALRREATGLLLLGASTLMPPQGEGAAQPRFRPRVHQIVRSLAGLWRCLNPACGHLREPGKGRCPDCQSAVLPLATCRTCGEAYWTSPHRGEAGAARALEAVDRHRGDPGIFVADPDRLSEIVDEDEEGKRVEWDDLWVCRFCAGAGPTADDVQHSRSCPSPESGVRRYKASTDDVHCPSCGDLGARDRPILLPLFGSAAASVAVLTQSLSDRLRSDNEEAGGRLLVFADSRQDAAQQAGYADDQGARVSVRQLVTDSLGAEPVALPTLLNAVRERVMDDPMTFRRWLVGEARTSFASVSDPSYVATEDDRKRIRWQIEWEVMLDLTERARRRFAPEQEGTLVVGLEGLDELVASVERAWRDHPFGDAARLREVIRVTADVLRHYRAVDHWMLKLTPRGLRTNQHLRIGDRGVRATTGFGERKFQSRDKQVDIRPWTADRNRTRFTELVGRLLGRGPTEVNELVERLASRLEAVGLLTRSPVEGRHRLMLDHRRIALARRTTDRLWRCSRCGQVRSAVLTDLRDRPICARWSCSGTPREWEPSSGRDFYRRQYLAKPRRLIVREHSGQIDSHDRIALETRFNDRENPTVDVLACTPTLEVGVSLDDLHAVMLRNLPPTPANYTQRVGRAGRRSRVALAVAHAGQGPHDSYFYERPELLIAGLVKAPTFSLENEPLLRRHVNSLVLETLGLDLPTLWVPPNPKPEGWSDPSIADEDGVLRESTLRPFMDRLADPEVRGRLDQAVRGAFAHPEDPEAPPGAEQICSDQVGQFVADLRESLNRWCYRYRKILDEFHKLRSAPGIPSRSDMELQERLYVELDRLAKPSSPEYRPLGFLGLVGFLPRYGFTGRSVMLHPPKGDVPITQAAAVAVTEFAPENVIYARGQKLRVRRLDPAPMGEAEVGADHRENVLREGRRCDRCEFLTFDPLVRACPECSADLIRQQIVELTGVRGTGGVISGDDEYREREGYDVLKMLSGEARTTEAMELGGFHIERTSGREIVVANRGPRAEEGDPPKGFDICTGCGLAVETQEEDEDAEQDLSGHFPRCPGRKDATGTVLRSGLWLTARLRGDIMEIALPQATTGRGFETWRATLTEALKVGIREVMQAGQRDLDSFERKRHGEPYSIVIYDTMPGGTGFMPKLFADRARLLKQAAAFALERLETCDCASSCYRCLRDFWNQRVHRHLNRFEIIGALRRLAEDEARPGEEPEDDRLESFLEVEFYDRVRSAGLPLPTLQVVREVGGRRVIRVDAEYRDPNISIFLDGRAFHAQTLEKIEDDLAVRNRLEARGVVVLEFTYHQVMDGFEEVAAVVRSALAASHEAPDIDPRSLPGLTVTRVDEVGRQIKVTVNAAGWLRTEAERERSLASANQLRLLGWRLERAAGSPAA